MDALLGEGIAPGAPDLVGNPADDAVLLRRVAGGDQDAFRALLARHAGGAHAVAMRILGNRALAEEVVQEVFLTVWERAAEYPAAQASIRTWIVTITHHRAVDRLRRKPARRARSNRLRRVGQPPREDPMAEPDDAGELRRRIGAMDRAIRSLPAEQWEVLHRMYFRGQTGARIAVELGVPLPTVRSRVLLAMRRLRLSLGAA